MSLIERRYVTFEPFFFVFAGGGRPSLIYFGHGISIMSVDFSPVPFLYISSLSFIPPFFQISPNSSPNPFQTTHIRIKNPNRTS
jgi:hypothetical protein